MFEAPMALRSAQLLFVVLAGVQGSQIKSVGDLQGTSKSMFVPGHDGDAVTVAIAADGRIDTLTTVDSEFSGSKNEHADVTDPVHRDAMSAYVEADGSIHRMAKVVSESSGARRTDEHGGAADSLATVAKVRSVGGRLVDPSERLQVLFKSLTHQTDLNGKLTSRMWGRNVKKNEEIIGECFGGDTLAEKGKAFGRMVSGPRMKPVSWDQFVAAALPACGGSGVGAVLGGPGVGGGGHDDATLEAIFKKFTGSPDTPIKNSKEFGRKLNLNKDGDKELAEEVGQVFCLKPEEAGKAYYKIKGEEGTLTKAIKQKPITFDEFKSAAKSIPHPCH